MNKENIEKIKKILYNYLKNCKLMQVAVSDGKNPSIFNCWFSYDDKYNFYFISPDYSIHSKIIKNNPNVAIAITDTKFNTEFGNDVVGVSFKGRAKQPKGKELLTAYSNFLRRYPKVGTYIKYISNKKLDLSLTKIYKIETDKLILYDEVDFKEGEERQEIDVKDLLS
ncbi:MAG: pyridoxamine 5'-phosphate oxidase family protein [Nanoarchaeota archaeon]